MLKVCGIEIDNHINNIKYFSCVLYRLKYRIEYTLGEGDFESKFIRTCPVGIKSCFGAKGFYDRDDKDLLNDICKYLKVIILNLQFRITKMFLNRFSVSFYLSILFSCRVFRLL